MEDHIKDPKLTTKEITNLTKFRDSLDQKRIKIGAWDINKAEAGRVYEAFLLDDVADVITKKIDVLQDIQNKYSEQSAAKARLNDLKDEIKMLEEQKNKKLHQIYVQDPEKLKQDRIKRQYLMNHIENSELTTIDIDKLTLQRGFIEGYLEEEEQNKSVVDSGYQTILIKMRQDLEMKIKILKSIKNYQPAKAKADLARLNELRVKGDNEKASDLVEEIRFLEELVFHSKIFLIFIYKKHSSMPNRKFISLVYLCLFFYFFQFSNQFC